VKKRWVVYSRVRARSGKWVYPVYDTQRQLTEWFGSLAKARAYAAKKNREEAR